MVDGVLCFRLYYGSAVFAGVTWTSCTVPVPPLGRGTNGKMIKIRRVGETLFKLRIHQRDNPGTRVAATERWREKK